MGNLKRIIFAVGLAATPLIATSVVAPAPAMAAGGAKKANKKGAKPVVPRKVTVVAGRAYNNALKRQPRARISQTAVRRQATLRGRVLTRVQRSVSSMLSRARSAVGLAPSGSASRLGQRPQRDIMSYQLSRRELRMGRTASVKLERLPSVPRFLTRR